MRPKSPGLTTLVVAAAILMTSTHSFTQARPQAGRRVERVNGREAAAGEVLVKLRPGLPASVAASLAQLGDATTAAPLGRSGLRRIRSRSLDTSALLARFRAHPDVLYAEPNFVVHALAEPSDPFLPQLWGLQNVGQSVNGGAPGRPGADIHAERAWDVSFGSAAHVVAVVDTGIDYTHPDLAVNVWSAPSAFTVTIGGVTLTCPAGSHGFDAIAFTCDPMDDHNHGTHVSGTIGAAGGNGTGVVGVNWTTRLMGIKFLDASGSGTVADAINGIEFALQVRDAFAATGGADVRVLSNSWGGRDFSQALDDEIAATAAADMLFVAAAGNDGFSNDWWPAYPASYGQPNIIAVAATTNTDDRAWFSNYGTQSVHLGAPGVDVYSTTIGNSYAYASGTSMAAPHVSGAAALVLSRCDLDTPTLKQVLLATVERVPSLASYTITGGRLDVNSAIRACAAPPGAPIDLAAAAGNARVTLSWSRVAGATGYRVKRSVTPGGGYVAIAAAATPGFTDATAVNGTTYYYVVSGTNLAGEGPDSTEASATPKAPSDLVVSALTVPSTGGAGLSVSITETTKNQGGGPSNPTVTRVFFSRNAALDTADTVVGVHQVPALAPGAQSDVTLSLDLPSDLTPGYYYVIAKADADGVETETQEYNNTAPRLITVGPDLVVSGFTVPTSAGAGTSVPVTVTVKNQGGGAAAAATTRFYLSVNAAWEAGDTQVPGGLASPHLAPGATATASTTITIPAGTAAGSYYVLARADGDGSVAETQEGNNAAARYVQIGGDLVVSALTVPARAAAGGALVLSDSTRNSGAGAIDASVTRFYLSSNVLLDAGDTLLPGGRAVPALAAGATSTGSTTVTLPAGLTAGTYYVIAKADGDGLLAETLETNNTLARSTSVGPDLAVTTMTVPYNVASGATITITDTVQNQGAEAAPSSTMRFYLSANVAFDASDLPLETSRTVPALAGGTSSSGATLVTIPAGTSGGWFVIGKADADGAIAEGVETNNTMARAIQVAP